MRRTTFGLALALGTGLWMQASPARADEATAPETPANVAGQLEEMKKALESQQQQIQQLRKEVQSRDQSIEQMQQQIDKTELTATETAKISAEQREEKKEAKKAFTLTPGGFLEATAIYRTANQNADVGSTFGNIPFDGTANSHLSEFRGTARQSRLSLLAEGFLDDTKVTGYYEMDFLADAPTGNQVESNSFSPRIRQLFTDVDFDNGISLLAGQAWSLMTTSRQGITPRREFVPWTIDAQYNVGYNWARQWQARLTDKLTDNLWVAVAAENPETTLNVVNPPNNVLGFNTSQNAQSPGSQFTLSNTPGANGISTDFLPDLTGKVVFEPGFGHYEFKALGRFFRDRFNGNNDYATGEGIGAAAILPVTDELNFTVQTLDGWGIGRYASGQGADVTLRPNGQIVPIPTLDLFGGFEGHPNENWDLYTYAGIEYYGQKAFQNGKQGVGYGTPGANNSGCETDVTGTCQAQNRLVWQIQPGFWYRFYRGPAGTLAAGMSYSFVHRDAWAGLNGLSPAGHEHIIMSSLRYYLP
ncbi:MAG TPA: hypothetical protein VK714_20925 [Myxococcota bacterium]|nr:hypothetical protein [Myxococcota bacterium]